MLKKKAHTKRNANAKDKASVHGKTVNIRLVSFLNFMKTKHDKPILKRGLNEIFEVKNS